MFSFRKFSHFLSLFAERPNNTFWDVKEPLDPPHSLFGKIFLKKMFFYLVKGFFRHKDSAGALLTTRKEAIPG